MKKNVVLSGLLILLLTACGVKTDIASPQDATAVGTATAIVFPPTHTPGPMTCTVVSQDVVQGDLPMAEVKPEDWIRGSEDAVITIIQYADFQMDFYAALAATFVQLQTEYPDQIRIIYRSYPLYGPEDAPWHDKTFLAMQAAEAAGTQDRFWEMHDLLYSTQPEWADLTPEEFPAWIVKQANDLEMDSTLFYETMTSEGMANYAYDSWTWGVQVGLPYDRAVLLINGEGYSGPMGYDSLKSIIELTLLKEKQFKQCPPQLIETGKEYVAVFHTEKGPIRVALFPEIAPFTVNSFVFLARNGWYDNTSFHRVIEGLLAQGGDPTGTGAGTPGYFFGLEVHPNLLFNRPGLLAMANAGSDANGSQFFFTMDSFPAWDQQYTIFGEVIEGMAIVKALTVRDPASGEALPDADLLLRITIEER